MVMCLGSDTVDDSPQVFALSRRVHRMLVFESDSLRVRTSTRLESDLCSSSLYTDDESEPMEKTALCLDGFIAVDTRDHDIEQQACCRWSRAAAAHQTTVSGQRRRITYVCFEVGQQRGSKRCRLSHRCLSSVEKDNDTSKRGGFVSQCLRAFLGYLRALIFVNETRVFLLRLTRHRSEYFPNLCPAHAIPKQVQAT